MNAAHSQVRITIRYHFASDSNVPIFAIKRSYQIFFFYVSFVSLFFRILHENTFTKRSTLHKSNSLQIEEQTNISDDHEDLYIFYNRNSPFKAGDVLTPKGDSLIKMGILVENFEKTNLKGTKIIFFTSKRYEFLHNTLPPVIVFWLSILNGAAKTLASIETKQSKMHLNAFIITTRYEVSSCHFDMGFHPLLPSYYLL